MLSQNNPKHQAKSKKLSQSGQADKQVLRFWQNQNTFHVLERLREKGEPFVFYEGPPTANGQPGLHHLLARAYKDVILRFYSMRGKSILRQSGWDTHGLPVELQVEKELGISGKQDIEKYGVARFNRKCRQSVLRYTSKWREFTKRMGYWLDLDHPYITYKTEYIEQVWKLLKQIDAKGLLYEGHKVVPHCPRCETALSSHEVAQGYKIVKQESIFVKFPITSPPAILAPYKKLSFLAWTTTPWTLPGNVALALGKDIEYSLVKQKTTGEHFILATSVIDQLGFAGAIKTFTGKQLSGISYSPPYSVLNTKEKTPQTHRSALGDFVTTEEGTGIVHTAVMYGVDDYQLGEKNNLPKIHTVSPSGKFYRRVKQFANKSVFSAEKLIIKDLKQRKLLFRTKTYRHSYPFCWRCDTPLIYYGKKSWFIAVSKIRKQLLEQNQRIRWVPDYYKKGRFGRWLAEAKDWALSRERYWGTPLPIWKCHEAGCRYYQIIDSVSQLAKLTGVKLKDVHKPYIDRLTWRCAKCKKGQMKREDFVIDVWFDSGAMPFASGMFQKGLYPADFIAEAVDQTRGWFYTLLAIGTLVGQGTPYKAVISTGHIQDDKGKKMSKSRGNVVDPMQAMDQYGADSVRFYLYSVNRVWENKLYVEKDVKTVHQKVFQLLENVARFFFTYSSMDKWRPSSVTKQKLTPFILDRWILARRGQLVKQVTNRLEKLDVTGASREIALFIEDLSVWYLRLSRKRRNKAFYSTIWAVLRDLVLVMAPFAPFTSERLYQKLKLKSDPASVHLAFFPQQKLSLKDEKILQDMAQARQVVSQGLKQRAEKKVPVRQPLPSGLVNSSINPKLYPIIASELNVKRISSSNSKNSSTKLNFKLTASLILEGKARQVVRTIQNLRRKAGYRYDQVVSVYLGSAGSLLRAHQKMIETATLTKISTKRLPFPDIAGKEGKISIELQGEGDK